MSTTATTAPVLECLAGLLAYPDPGFLGRVPDARRCLEAAAPAVAAPAATFLGFVEATSTADLEELYARTFDWSPERALELGWHLFGEQYDRGAFLVRMRALLRAHGVAEDENLPDHLAGALRLLGRMEPEPARDLIARHLGPAVERLVKGFEKTPENPYEALVRAVAAAVAERAGGER